MMVLQWENPYIACHKLLSAKVGIFSLSYAVIPLFLGSVLFINPYFICQNYDLCRMCALTGFIHSLFCWVCFTFYINNHESDKQHIVQMPEIFMWYMWPTENEVYNIYAENKVMLEH